MERCAVVPRKQQETKPDPIERIDAALCAAWEEICETVDVVVEMPPLPELFAGTDGSLAVNDAAAAAEAVIVNMLSEVMEWVCRFSPWYTKPASAYGLTRVHDPQTGGVLWKLSPEGWQRWREIFLPLSAALEGKGNLVQIFLLAEDLMAEAERAVCVPAACGCLPPRYILVHQAVVDEVEIVCDVCQQRFREVKEQ
jgi:hypothetical protein